MTAAIRKNDLTFVLERLKGPSSTWTYLVNENQFGWGMEMIKGKNIGFAATAAILAPLFVPALIADRFSRRKRALKQ